MTHDSRNTVLRYKWTNTFPTSLSILTYIYDIYRSWVYRSPKNIWQIFSFLVAREGINLWSVQKNTERIQTSSLILARLVPLLRLVPLVLHVATVDYLYQNQCFPCYFVFVVKEQNSKTWNFNFLTNPKCVTVKVTDTTEDTKSI